MITERKYTLAAAVDRDSDELNILTECDAPGLSLGRFGEACQLVVACTNSAHLGPVC